MTRSTLVILLALSAPLHGTEPQPGDLLKCYRLDRYVLEMNRITNAHGLGTAQADKALVEDVALWASGGTEEQSIAAEVMGRYHGACS